MENLRKQLNIETVEQYNALTERTIKFCERLKSKADELQIKSNEIFEQLQKDPANLDLQIDYIVYADSAINLLEKRKNFAEMLNKLEKEFKEELDI